MMRAAAGACALALLLAGCASAPGVPAAAESLVAPAPGQGVIYVMRIAHILGVGTPADVAIDGKAMATLWNGQYIASAVAPGRHVVRITWHLHSDEVVIDVPAGSRRFVETEWKTTPCGAVPSGSCAYTRAAVAPQQAALALLGGMSPAITPSY